MRNRLKVACFCLYLAAIFVGTSMEAIGKLLGQ
jgi:hypothetical protein